ncbi:MBL fold metallo-hydrolase [Natronomonas marina]|uniref:MBL fold metallo-hydrolase n=1 Tax=Natronomonas marina TaxID=2961939 RepID=UPI0020C9BC21|nr:MBL fold metallo-hydrolase [Natronomonas marina]
MNLQFLGGAREVGRSAVLVDDSLLLDFGLKTADPPQYPVAFGGHGSAAPDAVVVSHGHLDHAGAVPALLSGDARPPVHWTPPTRELALTLARDTLKLHGGTPRCPFTEEDVRRVTEVSETHGYRDPFEAAGYCVEFFDAGHVPGSAHVLVDDGDTTLLYTGDFHAGGRGQRLVAPSTARPDADVVVTESTYADVTHEPRAAVEERFVDSVRTTLWEGGTVVVPAFAIGRTQEMMLVCAAHDIDCYVDGMGVEVTRMLRRHPEYLRDGDAFARAVSNARVVDGRDGQRRRIADQSTVIITTAGMLSGGPAMTYVPEIHANPVNKLCFSGYQVEGTPGRAVLETGSAEIGDRHLRVSATVEAYDFSAHADREGLFEFLDAYRNTPILVNHGDSCEWFAGELDARGHDARAPELGETVEV